jgi:hypothetical protein
MADDPGGGVADNPGPSSTPGGGWVPIPDPTKLTDEAINRATAAYRRELDGLRELLSERIETSRNERVRALTALQTLIEQRLAGMDRATDLLAAGLRQVPTALDERITALRELIESRLEAIGTATTLHNEQVPQIVAKIEREFENARLIRDEKFAGVTQRFAERDIRFDQASRASEAAIAAALQAAKELVNAQGAAAASEARKTEGNFTKQIDGLATVVATLDKTIDGRITELKERIDRGEGAGQGAAGQRGEQRLNMSQVIAAIATLAAVLGFILYAVKR